jgi:cyanuric acid amidohydrolase
VTAAMHEARIDAARDVHFVQVKCPCITAARAEAAKARGKMGDHHRPQPVDGHCTCCRCLWAWRGARGNRATDRRRDGLASEFLTLSLSSGMEVDANEVIVLGNSGYWSGPLKIAHRPTGDVLDIGAVVDVLRDLGISALPRVGLEDCSRLRAVLVKCEPDRRGHSRGYHHTMLDDTDINARRHARGAVGGLVAGVVGDTRIFVSGGAEHQGPDGGGLIAVVAQSAPGV